MQVTCRKRPVSCNVAVWSGLTGYRRSRAGYGGGICSLTRSTWACLRCRRWGCMSSNLRAPSGRNGSCATDEAAGESAIVKIMHDPCLSHRELQGHCQVVYCWSEAGTRSLGDFRVVVDYSGSSANYGLEQGNSHELEPCPKQSSTPIPRKALCNLPCSWAKSFGGASYFSLQCSRLSSDVWQPRLTLRPANTARRRNFFFGWGARTPAS